MLKQDWFYNTENFPFYISTCSNWSLWANGSGYCAAIPTPKMQRQGCQASHFGTMKHGQQSYPHIRLNW